MFADGAMGVKWCSSFLSTPLVQETQPCCVPTDDSGGFESLEVLGSKTWSIVAEIRALDAN